MTDDERREIEALFLAAKSDPGAYLAIGDWFEENRAEHEWLPSILQLCGDLAAGRVRYGRERQVLARYVEQELVSGRRGRRRDRSPGRRS